jgi:hypothetical protein
VPVGLVVSWGTSSHGHPSEAPRHHHIARRHSDILKHEESWPKARRLAAAPKSTSSTSSLTSDARERQASYTRRRGVRPHMLMTAMCHGGDKKLKGKSDSKKSSDARERQASCARRRGVRPHTLVTSMRHGGDGRRWWRKPDEKN